MPWVLSVRLLSLNDFPPEGRALPIGLSLTAVFPEIESEDAFQVFWGAPAPPGGAACAEQS